MSDVRPSGRPSVTLSDFHFDSVSGHPNEEVEESRPHFFFHFLAGYPEISRGRGLAPPPQKKYENFVS